MTKEYLNNPYTPDEEVHWDFISLAMRSVADTCIIRYRIIWDLVIRQELIRHLHSAVTGCGE